MKNLFTTALGLISFFVTLGAVMALLAGSYSYKLYKDPGPLTEETIIHIQRGQSLKTITSTLADQGVIDHPWLFTAASRIKNVHTKLKAGEYIFPARISAEKVLEKLEAGDVYLRQITIPEGLTVHEIIALVKQTEGLGDLTLKEIPAEGTLLPETYSYEKGESLASIIARMKKAKSELVAELWEKRKENLPIKTQLEAITLASIVEKETGVAKERAKVAGVFINRLNIGMPLQSDPTVIYAITEGAHKNEGQGPIGRRLLRKDLKIESPYNTYMVKGLPPGPIANPGKDALEAVLNPAEHDYLYFVADGSGGHAFGKTLEEHNRNVAKWRRIRKEKQNPKD